MMSAVHWHTIPGAHLDGAVGPGCRKPYDDTEIPPVPAGVRDIIETKLVAGPMLGGISFLKNLATLLIEIHPRADSKRLVQVEISGLAEADFRFPPEFSSLTSRPIFIEDFPSNELSIVVRRTV